MPFHKPRVDLKKRIKEIMTSPTSGTLCVSENTELFQQVMQEFNGYELAVSYLHLLYSVTEYSGFSIIGIVLCQLILNTGRIIDLVRISKTR